jgi:hypothetical protein
MHPKMWLILQPVPVETYFNSAGEHRARPCSSVAHLIKGIGIIINR